MWVGDHDYAFCPICDRQWWATILDIPPPWDFMRLRCERGHVWERPIHIDEQHHVFPPEPRPAYRLVVCRGPTYGRWRICVHVDSHAAAERHLSDWRAAYPDQVQALYRDGKSVEDGARRQIRLLHERQIREAEYFLRLAGEARGEGKFADARYYRRCAHQFLDGSP